MSPDLNERQSFIYQQIENNGEVKVLELAQILEVSEMTIRRDLEKLENLGLVKRTFGGAILLNSYDITLRERSCVMIAEKMRIGRKSAEFIKLGEAIFIDAGSTTLEVARHLRRGMDITVVTNAINIAAELLEKQISTIVVGGILREATSSLVGPDAEEMMRKMAFDSAFLGAAGLAVDGLSNSNIFEAEIKKMAIRQAAVVNIVVDHSKFGIRSLASFAELSQVNRIISDERLPENIESSCNEKGIEIVIS